MKRKILALVSSVLFLFSLASCNKDGFESIKSYKNEVIDVEFYAIVEKLRSYDYDRDYTYEEKSVSIINYKYEKNGQVSTSDKKDLYTTNAEVDFDRQIVKEVKNIERNETRKDIYGSYTSEDKEKNDLQYQYTNDRYYVLDKTEKEYDLARSFEDVTRNYPILFKYTIYGDKYYIDSDTYTAVRTESKETVIKTTIYQYILKADSITYIEDSIEEYNEKTTDNNNVVVSKSNVDKSQTYSFIKFKKVNIKELNLNDFSPKYNITF